MISRVREGGRSQNLRLFIRGKAMSGVLSIRGSSQLPNPPIMIGITMKKIIMKAWAVTITLNSCSLLRKGPGCDSSVRIISLIDVPRIPDHTPKMKYSVPMSLWLVEYIHRCI